MKRAKREEEGAEVAEEAEETPANRDMTFSTGKISSFRVDGCLDEWLKPVTRLIVGLGNPGPDYAFDPPQYRVHAVDRLWQIRLDRRSSAGPMHQYCRGRIAGVPMLAVKPLAYMNRSGDPVSEIIRNTGFNARIWSSSTMTLTLLMKD
jgi:hypothetical protein